MSEETPKARPNETWTQPTNIGSILHMWLDKEEGAWKHDSEPLAPNAAWERPKFPIRNLAGGYGPDLVGDEEVTLYVEVPDPDPEYPHASWMVSIGDDIVATEGTMVCTLPKPTCTERNEYVVLAHRSDDPGEPGAIGVRIYIKK